MIWHIFKKDWKLLWPLVLAVAIGNVANAALWMELGHFIEPRQLGIVALFLQLGVWLAGAFLIITVVHQDAIPGDRQDWLTRPIKPHHLLLAKLLFLLLAVQGPLVLSNLITGLVEGFRLNDTLQASLFSSVALLVFFNFAVFGAATVTRTISELIGWVIAIGVVVMIADEVVVMALAQSPNMLSRPLGGTGLHWFVDTSWFSLALLAAILIIPLQYFLRATLQSRIIVAVLTLLAMLPPFLTVSEAFGIQRLLGTHQSAAAPIAIAFSPDLGKSLKQPDEAPGEELRLPIRVSGLPPDSFVGIDRAEVRLIDSNGAILYRGSAKLKQQGGAKFEILARSQSAGPGEVGAYQQIPLPQRIVDAVGGKVVRVEVDYLLTLVQANGSMSISAENGNERTKYFGWCKSKVDTDAGEVDVGCLIAGDGPRCITTTLENRSTGMRNPDNEHCLKDYAPAHLGFLAMNKMVTDLPYHDSQGLAKYPVDESQLPEARAIVKSYEPTAYFKRRLVIPEIELRDWWIAMPVAKPTASRP